MEQPGILKVITEDVDGITVAMRHQWQRVSDSDLNCMKHYAVVSGVITNNGIYQIMHDVDPMNFRMNGVRSKFKLLKYMKDDETGEIILMSIDISAEEAIELIDHADQFTWN